VGPCGAITAQETIISSESRFSQASEDVARLALAQAWPPLPEPHAYPPRKRHVLTMRDASITAAFDLLSTFPFRDFIHDFFGCADNRFSLSHLCSSGHGAWGQCVPCWGASKTLRVKQIMVGIPAQLPKTQVSFSTLNFEPSWAFCGGFGKTS